MQINVDLELTGLEIPTIDFCLYGDKKESENVSENAIDEVDIQKRVQFGDLWKLGDKHYLICANSLKEDSFRYLLGDLKADMVFTDAPYNCSINGYVCGKGKIKHKEFAMASGEMKDPEFTEFLRTVIQNLIKFTIDGSIHFQCMDWKHAKNMLDAAEENYSELKNICVWDKGVGGMGSLYRSAHELVIVFKNGNSPHINNIQLGKFGRNRTNVWSYPGVSVTNPSSLNDLKLHPTMKNLEMVMDAILDCSNPNSIILDAFGGSGTTLIAAEKTNRRGYIIEIDPHYCDVILHRFETMTGKSVELVKNIGGDING